MTTPERVYEPGRIGGVEIRNRIVRTSHATNFARGHEVTDDLIDYHLRPAQAGVGLSVLEIGGVHPSSPGTLDIWDDAIILGYERLMGRIRPTGMKVFQQLWHGGSQAFLHRDGPLWSAWPLQPTTGGGIPRAIGQGQIDDLVESYAAAAVRVVKGGLDGIEVQLGHGYLIHQFLSPLVNRREDGYGGGLAGRMRLALEVVAAVRDAVGGAVPVGVRASTDEAPGGFGADELIELLAELERRGHVDYVSLATGSYFRFEKILGGMYEPPGYQLEVSGPVAATVTAPTLVTGRMTTLEEAEQVLVDGVADFVALTRAHIADPLLMEKTRTGRAAQVRPCIACDTCLAGTYAGRLVCTVNPAIGREATAGDHLLTRVSQPGHVVVVGGGPAGLEAARAAATRGHRVTLLEQGGELGGQLAVARLAPKRDRLGVFVDWLEREVRRVGVEVRFEACGTPGLIDDLAPDAVIVATGSRPRLDGVQSGIPAHPLTFADGRRPLSSWEVLSASEPWRGSALVVDDSGHYEAIAVAERLILDGVSVTYTTRHSAFASLAESTFEVPPALRRLRSGAGDFQCFMRCQAVSAASGQAVIEWVDGGPAFTVNADHVVFVSPNAPVDTLVGELAGRPFEAIAVGDALSPRYLRIAVMEGHDAGAWVLPQQSGSEDSRGVSRP